MNYIYIYNFNINKIYFLKILAKLYKLLNFDKLASKKY